MGLLKVFEKCVGFEEEDRMSFRNGTCRCNNSGSNSSCSIERDPYYSLPWYCKLIKPVTFLIITTMLAISGGHLWAEYSASESFWTVKTELAKVTSHLSTLSMEVKNLIESRDELKSKLRQVVEINEANDLGSGASGNASLTTEIGSHTKTVLNALSSENVREVVRRELETYDADKTGRTDYALESLGGSIVSTRDTRPYTDGAPVLRFLGIPLCAQQNTPRTVIQAGSLPGECWAFAGTTGSVTIRLIGRVYVTGVSLEHISSSISPTDETTTAPRDFSVWGLDRIDDEDGFLFGEFTYDNRGSSLQYYQVQFQSEKPYEIIEFKIHSNSGNPDFTCVYRIRVHGSLLASVSVNNVSR